MVWLQVDGRWRGTAAGLQRRPAAVLRDLGLDYLTDTFLGGITKSRVREFERRRGILGDATVTSTPYGPRGRGVPRHERVYHRHPHRAPADRPGRPHRRSSGMGPAGCSPEAIEAEVAAWIDDHAHLKDDAGRQQVVRNGHLPERTIQTGIGPIEVQQPRVRDRRPADQREAFTSAILPPYLRKTKSLEELIPWLYLKGVSTGDFSEALQAMLGPERRACRRRPSPGSRPSGRTSSRPGASDRSRGSITSTCGPTGCTSTSGWRRAGSASWC